MVNVPSKGKNQYYLRAQCHRKERICLHPYNFSSGALWVLICYTCVSTGICIWANWLPFQEHQVHFCVFYLIRWSSRATGYLWLDEQKIVRLSSYDHKARRCLMWYNVLAVSFCSYVHWSLLIYIDDTWRKTFTSCTQASTGCVLTSKHLLSEPHQHLFLQFLFYELLILNTVLLVLDWLFFVGVVFCCRC